MTQTRTYAGPFVDYTPDIPGGLAWPGFGPSNSHVDSLDSTGYKSLDLTGRASLAHVLYADDGVIPALSRISGLALTFRLGQDSLVSQGGLHVIPYVRFADGAPLFHDPIAVPYLASFADYTVTFPRDPNGLPWTRQSIFRLRGQQLRFGLRTDLSEFVSAQVYWAEARFGVVFALPEPLVYTDPASLVGDDTARLNGRINPRGANGTYPLTYWFEYGTTTAYGSTTTPIANVTGDVEVAVFTDVSGLTASTGYHFRLVAQTLDGLFYGEDQFFSTQAAGTDRWRLDEYKRLPTGEFTAADRTRMTSWGFDVPSTSGDDSSCPFLVFP